MTLKQNFLSVSRESLAALKGLEDVVGHLEDNGRDEVEHAARVVSTLTIG
jgi:hypothetical protein